MSNSPDQVIKGLLNVYMDMEKVLTSNRHSTMKFSAYHEGSVCSRSHKSRSSEETVPRKKRHKIMINLRMARILYAQEN